MAVFEYLHFALSVPPLGPLDNSERLEPTITREGFLRYLFDNRHDFFHRGALFTYVPARSPMLDPSILAGFVGRLTSELENAGPDELFALTPRNRWRASFVAADLSPTRQIVAVEKRGDVGSAHRVMESLVSSATSTAKAGLSWHVDIEYVTRPQAFKEAAERFRGKITELEFTFNPPNALRGFDRFKEFDRLAVRETNAENSQYSLKNPAGGIEAKGDFVESAVDYAHEGAGRVKIKTGKQVAYDSRQSKKTTSVPETLMPREGDAANIAATAHILHMAPERKSEDGNG